jgi:hypothetical protein
MNKKLADQFKDECASCKNVSSITYCRAYCALEKYQTKENNRICLACEESIKTWTKCPDFVSIKEDNTTVKTSPGSSSELGLILI